MTPLRQGLLSVLVLAVAAGGWYVAGHGGRMLGASLFAPAQLPAGREPGKGAGPRSDAVLVVAGPVTSEAIGDRLTALGSTMAVQAITLYAQTLGFISAIDVHAGDHVTAGAVLIRLDDREQTIAVDKARIAVADALRVRDRANQLAKSQAGTQVDLSNAEVALAKAENDQQGAELALARRAITAPFDGVVGMTTLSVGELVTPATPLVTLDDLSAITVMFDAPQRFATLIRTGSPVAATAEGLPGVTIKGAVRGVDSRLDETARTFKVRATLTEGIAGLKPGMAIVVSFAGAGVSQTVVSSSAVLWDRQGSYVWKLDGKVARRTAVQILGRRSGTVIVAGDLKQGDEVAIEGLQRLHEGAPVVRADDQGAAPGAAPPQKQPGGTSDVAPRIETRPSG